MQMKNTFLAAAVMAAAVLTSASDLSAAAWLQPNGNFGNYVYSGGTDTDGEFGSPTTNANGFEFSPASFRAVSVGNQSDLETDTLKVNVSTADQSKSITSVKLEEVGDYVIDNVGGVKAFAGLFVRVLDADWSFSQRVFTANFTSLPGFPVSGDSQGNWIGGVVVNLPAGARSVSITVNNTLQSNSNVGGSALIQKKEVDLSFPTIPEPTSLAVILGGFGFAAIRRRMA